MRSCYQVIFLHYIFYFQPNNYSAIVPAMEQKVPNNFQFNKKTETTVLPVKSSNYLMTSFIMASSSSNGTTPVAVSSSASRVSSSSGSDAQSPLSGAEASLLLLHREKEAGSVIHAPSRSNSQLRGEARGAVSGRGGAALGWSGTARRGGGMASRVPRARRGGGPRAGAPAGPGGGTPRAARRGGAACGDRGGSPTAGRSEGARGRGGRRRWLGLELIPEWSARRRIVRWPDDAGSGRSKSSTGERSRRSRVVRQMGGAKQRLLINSGNRPAADYERKYVVFIIR